MRHLILFMISFSLIPITALISQAAERDCNYTVYVKSNEAGIGSIPIYNSNVTATGRFKGGAHSDDASEARKEAAKAAKKCFDAAFLSNEIPAECKPREWKSKRDGIMSDYKIPVLKTSAFNTICSYVHTSGKGGDAIRGIQIYTTNISNSSSDVKKECSIRTDSIYYTPSGASGLYTECNNGIAVGLKEMGGKTRWTGWYDESGGQIRNRIRDFCMYKFNMYGNAVLKYEVQQGNGKLRAKYQCK